MLTVTKRSSWKFVTSSSGGLGVDFVMGEGGILYLTDPHGVPVAFRYGALGAGVAAGFKLPKIGKAQINIKGRSVVGTVAPAAFPNGGVLFVLDTCKGGDLTQSDIRGGCLFVEVGGGLIAGASATAMLLGLSPAWLLALAAAPEFAVVIDQNLLQSASGVLVMGGVNLGLQAGAGAGAFVGGLW
jgi:hypothetical protein